MKKAKIVMYHYVRPIENSTYPKIKGLEIKNFKRQIEYLDKKFGFADVNYILENTKLETKKEQSPAILTFDDGFKDHYRYVFPVLKNHAIRGLFFPPAKPIMEKTVLDVHKIHFILAKIDDKSAIIRDIFDQLDFYRKDYEIEKSEELWKRLAIPTRFDSGDTMFIKRILQRELPQQIRYLITNYLFDKYVTSDESEFSEELYLSLDEINEMRESEMYFSSHSYSHEWLSYLSSENLEIEIKKSLNFCNKINPNGKQIMCYPYGNYNELVVEKLIKNGFVAGLTTVIGDADITKETAFRLNRYDTNDFPQ